MLRYELRNTKFDYDEVIIGYDNYQVEDYFDDITPKLYITLENYKDYELKIGDTLNIKYEHKYVNRMGFNESYLSQQKGDIIAVDNDLKMCTFLIDKYQNLSLDRIKVEYNLIRNIFTFQFEFNYPHCYDVIETFADIYVQFDNKILVCNNIVYGDCQTLLWEYNEYDDNASLFFKKVLPDFNLEEFLEEHPYPTEETFSEFDYLYNFVVSNENLGLLIFRDQVAFERFTILGNKTKFPEITIYSYKLSLQLPLEGDNEVSLLQEELLNEKYIETEKIKAVNSYLEMEKHMYSPVAATYNKSENKYDFVPINTINFNLHLREHSGENWTVENSDTWNCMTDKYKNVYGNVSNQSDLLVHLDFSNNDVKYQKSKLKKSFLRILFYDSMEIGNQNLISYSTIFLDSNKLYSKYIRNQSFSIYNDINIDEDKKDNILDTGVRVDREVNVNKLKELLGVDEESNVSDDEIENYRLSSQFQVQNKWLSKGTSEGFYLYNWVDNKTDVIPENIYMKIEFNHAGYGRTLPMMCPYHSDGSGFKTIYDIKKDWNSGGSGGYNVKQYQKYSYIRWKYVYDKNSGEYVYFLDPEIYGDMTDKVLNINLFEARITF
jgi:hypothetical protein